jgi:hypothetical protein
MNMVEIEVMKRDMRVQLCDEVTDMLDKLVRDAHSKCTEAIPSKEFALHLAQARAYYTARLLVRSLLIKDPH